MDILKLSAPQDKQEVSRGQSPIRFSKAEMITLQKN